jgi:hypothetical protein
MDIDKASLARFLETISPWQHLYEYKIFSFVAIRSDNHYEILQGRMSASRQWISTVNLPRSYKTEKVIAGQIELNSLGLTIEDFLNKMCNGSLLLEDAELHFPTDTDGRISMHFIRHDITASEQGKRLTKLQLAGKQHRGQIPKIELDWYLKGQLIPYDSLDDLGYAFGTGQLELSFANIEIHAGHVCEVNFSGTVDGTTARLGILVPNRQSDDQFSIGYKVFSGGEVLERGAIRGSEFSWRAQDGYLTGEKQISVPLGAKVQCYSTFAEVAQHTGWIGDPKSIPNLKGLVFDEIDEDFKVLKGFLFDGNRSKKDGRDFEQAVSWLYWMLGFSVAHPGHKLLSDNVDIVAITPKGHLLLIECTTGLLSKEGKIQSLLSRTAAMKKRLSAAGFNSTDVLPLGISSKENDEITEDVAEATNAGVLALCLDDLKQDLNKCFVPLDADGYFTNAQSELRRRRRALAGSEY